MADDVFDKVLSRAPRTTAEFIRDPEDPRYRMLDAQILGALRGDVGPFANNYWQRLGTQRYKHIAVKLTSLTKDEKRRLHDHMLDYGTAAARAVADFLRGRM